MIARITKAALMAAVSASAMSASVFAQEAEERRTVEVITVTAQQREESQQDVPLSIGAYNQQSLEQSGVEDIKDLISIAPGLMVTSTQSETITTARIRGIGTVGDNFGLESSVGVYIDGVFRARNGVGFGDLGELERIEVLRGPQGTLFGKNTSAGVLNVITQGPDMDAFGGHLETTFGDYGFNRYEGHITGPLIEDTLAFRLFGATAERDGYTYLIREDRAGNLNFEDSETSDYHTIRGQMLWTPNDRVEGRIIADFSERDELCCSAVQWDYTAPAAGLVAAVGGLVTVPADPEARVAYSNRPYEQNVEDWGISAEFDVELDGATLTSVTALRNWENSRSQDIDYSSADIAYRDADSNFTEIERFSQEFRLNGVRGDLDWLMGAFYSNEDLLLGDALRFGDDWESFLSLNAAALAGAPLDPAFLANTLNFVAGSSVFMPGMVFPADVGPDQDIYNQSANSWAIFTHNTYQLTENFSVTGGLRYTNEEKDVVASFSTRPTPGCAFLEGIFGPDVLGGTQGTALESLAPFICLPYARSSLDANGYDQSRSDEELSGTFRATYDINDDMMIYGGYSRGFKAGGFNLDRQFNGTTTGANYDNPNTAFAAEIVDSWEAGFKSQLFGNVLQLNGNIFFQQIDDFQLNTFNGVAFVVESIEEIESNGLELDFLYLPPISGLTISGGYAYVDAQYGDNITNSGLAGKTISLSPENFLTSQIIYERDLFQNLVGTFALDTRYVSDYNTGSDLDPEKVQDSFTLVNARASIGQAEGGWTIEVWGRNLTDETYAQVAFDAFAQGFRAPPGNSNAARGTASYDAFLGAPRTWGVTLRTEW